ncbi:hypothetical protein DY000_02062952 [Brassica cretica]|uniref:Uncharacterized protein n=1 Tax=Brassica cretica TaxID=69181 RepID=A0ABQ7ASQ6_BRACR|nr:hypothetical protein DY000_02062952 [Brassica cretica]
MQTVWNVPGRASGVNPSVFASGEPPPTLPPDPPDPTSPLSPVNFPTLTETTTNTVLYGSSRKGTRKESRSSHLTASSTDKRKVASTSSETTSMEIELETQTLSTNATIPESRSETATVQSTNSETNLIQNLTIIPPKNSSPIQTNKASSATLPSFPPPLLPPPVPVNSKPVSSTSGLAEKPAQNQTLVEVDLTVPLPPVVEFERENGEVVEVLVHYPWVPPTCSHCQELASLTVPPNPQTSSTHLHLSSFSSPDPPPRPSLKRSCSSPTLSSPTSSEPTPFSDKQNPFLPLSDNLLS